MNWLSEVIAQHTELESPLTFYWWSGLATISAVVKDNVWIDRAGAYQLYPNIFVMLHAKSGLKKGPPVSMARKLVEKVNNTRIISGRSSIQGILAELKETQSKPGGVVVKEATAFICSSELSSSLVEDKAAMNILTDLYDRHYYEGDWGHRLKDQKFNLKKPTITILAATNEAHSEEIFQKKDIQGGYIARTFIIYADKRNTINPLITPLKNPPNYDLLIPHLQKLSKLRGPFKPLHECEAGEYYEKWYRNELVPLQDEGTDDTGTLNRIGDSVLKVAMLLSLARNDDLVISLADMEVAITECTKLIGHTRRVTMGRSGKSSYANQKVMILEKLLQREPHMISRAQLYKDMMYHLNPNELDEIMLGFDQSGVIKIENHGGTMMYVMPEAQVEKLREFIRGRKK